MDWSNERWVKLYTRDTADWLTLSWQAQGLFALLLRKVNRLGMLDLGRHGKRGLAAHFGGGAAWASLEPALDELLLDGCVAIAGQHLIIPNFAEAQAATQSPAQRKRTQRERESEGAESQNVTAPSRKVTEWAHDVTPNHAMSHGVTAGHEASRDVTNRVEESRTEERRFSESETTSPPAADDAGASPAAPEGGRADTGAVGARGGATKARRGAPTDTLPPEPGSGAARALEALRACPTLWAIVARPNALCAAIGGEAYPAVDVAREIFAAEAWLVANPKNRKSDGPRFLTSWLTTAQNRAPRVGAPQVDGRHGRPMRPAPPVSVAVMPPPLPAATVDPARAAERRAQFMSALNATEKPS